MLQKGENTKNVKAKKSYVSIISVFVIASVPAPVGLRAADFASQLEEHFLKKVPVTEADQNMTMAQAVKHPVANRAIVRYTENFEGIWD